MKLGAKALIAAKARAKGPDTAGGVINRWRMPGPNADGAAAFLAAGEAVFLAGAPSLESLGLSAGIDPAGARA